VEAAVDGHHGARHVRRVFRTQERDHRGELAALADAPDVYATTAALSGAWRILAAMGFAPALAECSGCHVPMAPDDEVAFSHELGGVACERCQARAGALRRLPASARKSLAAWLDGAPVPPLSVDEGRAHQRLLREFVRYHLEEGRPLRAFAVWEHGGWDDRAEEPA